MQICTKKIGKSFTVHSVQTLKRASKITRIFRPALTDNAYSRQYSEMSAGKTGASTIFNAR
jgi:hypothetical protein